MPDDAIHEPSIGRPVAGGAAETRLTHVERRLEGIESALNDLNLTLQTFATEVDRHDDESTAVIEQAIDVRFQALSNVVRNSLNELGAQLVDETARSTRDIEAALREETGTVLMGLRARPDAADAFDMRR